MQNNLTRLKKKIYSIAWDISLHFKNTWKGTGFKAQLVTPSKNAALKYKLYLDEIGYVTSEVVISGPDDREDSETAFAKPTDRVQQFWRKMMDEHGNEKQYQDNIIKRFKKEGDPEIIIVVDKLLTGFDAPRNRVLYITRSLREHTLLQAIARVNRVFPGKEHGYIIDYYGIAEELGLALDTYSGQDDFEPEDLEGTITFIKEEVKKLPQKHSELWDLFKTIKNKYDAEAYQEHLADDAIRSVFYEKLSAFARLFKLALSTVDFVTNTPEVEMNRYKKDVSFFLSLRGAVQQRYSDSVDYKQYEPQIQKLIDDHVTSDEVVKLTDLVNIFDKKRFEEELEKVVGTAARADMIASRTQKTITEKMDEDPVFFKKLSELIQQTIADYRLRRITEAEFLKKAQEYKDQVLNHTDDDIPEPLQNRVVAQAFYGLTYELLKPKLTDDQTALPIATEAGLEIDNIIQTNVLDNGMAIVDWQNKSDLINKTKIDLDDYLFDLKAKYGIALESAEIDMLIDQSLEIAQKRYR